MIKSHEGELSRKGNRAQILLDFAQIYEELIHIAPEIIQAVVMSKDKELLNAEVDRTGLAICEKILNSITSIESEDEDNESPIL